MLNFHEFVFTIPDTDTRKVPTNACVRETLTESVTVKGTSTGKTGVSVGTGSFGSAREIRVVTTTTTATIATSTKTGDDQRCLTGTKGSLGIIIRHRHLRRCKFRHRTGISKHVL